jgi:hypothetical protein
VDKILALYQELSDSGVAFYTWGMKGEKAATLRVDEKYGIFMDFDSIHGQDEELAVLAHEGGHSMTGATHKVSSPYDLIQKHEYKANKWAVQKVVSAEELDEAIACGCADIWSLADKFNLPVDFMRMVVSWYTYGNLSDWKEIC